MALESKKSRVTLFFVIGFSLSLLMALLKALLAWATHTYLYSVPWIGGFLRSIELAEISNLLIFAILGVGIGGATYLLPRHWDHRAKLACLCLVSPFVFSASYMMQQHLWIKAVATQSNLAYRDARNLTNDYLEREAGNRGFFGFYPFSTQLAELPTRKETLQAEQSLNPNELLSQELASYDDPRADLAAYWFERVGWLIRFMYMTIAALTGLIYYFKGYAWAENRANASGYPSEQAVERQAKAEKPANRKQQSLHKKASQNKTPKNKKTKNKTPKNKTPKNKPSRQPQSTAAYRDLYSNDPLTKPINPSSPPQQKQNPLPKSPPPNSQPTNNPPNNTDQKPPNAS